MCFWDKEKKQQTKWIYGVFRVLLTNSTNDRNHWLTEKNFKKWNEMKWNERINGWKEANLQQIIRLKSIAYGCNNWCIIYF